MLLEVVQSACRVRHLHHLHHAIGHEVLCGEGVFAVVAPPGQDENPVAAPGKIERKPGDPGTYLPDDLRLGDPVVLLARCGLQLAPA